MFQLISGISIGVCPLEGKSEDELSMYFRALFSQKVFMPMRISPEELEVIQSWHIINVHWQNWIFICVNTLHFELAPIWEKSFFKDWYK